MHGIAAADDEVVGGAREVRDRNIDVRGVAAARRRWAARVQVDRAVVPRDEARLAGDLEGEIQTSVAARGRGFPGLERDRIRRRSANRLAADGGHAHDARGVGLRRGGGPIAGVVWVNEIRHADERDPIGLAPRPAVEEETLGAEVERVRHHREPRRGGHGGFLDGVGERLERYQRGATVAILIKLEMGLVQHGVGDELALELEEPVDASGAEVEIVGRLGGETIAVVRELAVGVGRLGGEDRAVVPEALAVVGDGIAVAVGQPAEKRLASVGDAVEVAVRREHGDAGDATRYQPVGVGGGDGDGGDADWEVDIERAGECDGLRGSGAGIGGSEVELPGLDGQRIADGAIVDDDVVADGRGADDDREYLRIGGVNAAVGGAAVVADADAEGGGAEPTRTGGSSRVRQRPGVGDGGNGIEERWIGDLIDQYRGDLLPAHSAHTRLIRRSGRE